MNPIHLHLEFAPDARQISRSNQIYLSLGVLALLLSLLFLANELSQNFQLSQQLRQVSDQDPTVRSTAHARPPSPIELSRAELVRKTTRNMATPWADLLMALETTPANVALLSVEPVASKHRVGLTAEAASEAQMLAYLRLLQADTRLTEVMLVSHQFQVQTPGAPLRFRVEAHWGDL